MKKCDKHGIDLTAICSCVCAQSKSRAKYRSPDCFVQFLAWARSQNVTEIKIWGNKSATTFNEIAIIQFNQRDKARLFGNSPGVVAAGAGIDNIENRS